MVSCPACRSAAVTTAIAVDVAPTSDGVVVNAPVDTAVCSDCGFAFNTAGARGKEAAFYSDAYDLLAKARTPSSSTKPVPGCAASTTTWPNASSGAAACGPAPQYWMLGAAKGYSFARSAGGAVTWSCTEWQPSRHARRFSERIVPGASIYEGLLAQSPFAARHFDLVTCVGVFEHVPDPVGFARDRQRESPRRGGFFSASPTSPTTRPTSSRTITSPALHQRRLRAWSRAGLMVEDIVVEGRVPMWALARQAREGEVPEVTPDFGSVARDAAAWFDSCLESLLSGPRAPGSDAHRIGVYGTGLILPAVVALGALDADRIVAFFDDNPHMQGATRLGRPVRPLADAPHLGITDMAFSANPVYLPRQGLPRSRRSAQLSGNLAAPGLCR